MTLSIIVLYFLPIFSIDLGIGLSINLISAIVSGIALITCGISYFWLPKKLITPVSIIIYWLVICVVAILIMTTSKETSPFIALWMIISLFASIFGVWGWLPILVLSGVFLSIVYIGDILTASSLVIILASSILPLIFSALIWRSKSRTDELDSENKAFHNLASELSEVSNQSEIVINAIGDGVIAIDGQGIVRLINPAAQEIIGWTKQDALALNYKSVLRLVDKKDDPLNDTNDPILQVLNANQQIRTNNVILVTKSDKKLSISLVVSPTGRPGSGVIAVFHDITKEKADEREQAEFISTASHEMRTPVAAIEGYLGLAMNPETAQIDDRARSYIDKAHTSAEHLGHLFQDLLDVSKSEDGRISNNPKVINVVNFVDEIVESLQPKAEAKGLILTYASKPNNNDKFIAPDYMANIDNDHLREVVNNLVENAIKYTQKGEVIVNVTGDEEHITISVKDSGIGIPAEDMPHLFQKFYRVDDKETRNIGGTGLGLYLSRRLTEFMGGRIWAESVYTKGSTFFVELPRISSQDANQLLEQQTLDESQKIVQPLTMQPEQPKNIEINKEPEPQLNTVPRGEALTPEQIAAYAANQHALAQQETATKPSVEKE